MTASAGGVSIGSRMVESAEPRATVRRVARQRRESQLQAAVLAVFRGYGIVCWPMNREKGGRKHAPHVGFKGLPDLGGVIPGGRAFYCEVKRPGETPTPEQVGAMRMLAKTGAFVALVKSVEQARDVAIEATRKA